LVRTFGKVPLVLTPSKDDAQDFNVPQNTEREILDQIIADLLTAQKTARADYGVGAYNKGRITLNAVNALLADVYLWDQQYDKCVATCDKILNNQSLQLVDGDELINSVFFTGNSKESIFELQFDKDIQYAIADKWRLLSSTKEIASYMDDFNLKEDELPDMMLVKSNKYAVVNIDINDNEASDAFLYSKHSSKAIQVDISACYDLYSVLKTVQDALDNNSIF
jgi:hypothetical protein